MIKKLKKIDNWLFDNLFGEGYEEYKPYTKLLIVGSISIVLIMIINAI